MITRSGGGAVAGATAGADPGAGAVVCAAAPEQQNNEASPKATAPTVVADDTGMVSSFMYVTEGIARPL